MYLPYDIQLLILNKVSKTKDKINFCRAWKELYVTEHERVLKAMIKDYIYKDYVKFRRFLRNFTYTQSELNEIIVETLRPNRLNSAIIWTSFTCGSYDLRFIFELLCVDKQYLTNDAYNTYDNFYRHFYPRLRSEIVPNDREQSKLNVQKNTYYTVLKPNFVPYNKNLQYRHVRYCTDNYVGI